MAEVNYNGKTVSYDNVKSVLSRVAEKLAANVNVSSGDRTATLSVGAGNKSHHLSGRAADFHVTGLSDEEAFKKIQEKSSELFDPIRDLPLPQCQESPHGRPSCRCGQDDTGSTRLGIPEQTRLA